MGREAGIGFAQLFETGAALVKAVLQRGVTDQVFLGGMCRHVWVSVCKPTQI